MVGGWYLSATSPDGSSSTVTVLIPWFFRNASAFFLSLSMLTVRMTTSFPLYLSASLSSSGISFLHGSHHDAQKSTNTTFPLSDERSTVFPLRSFREKVGARSPAAC